jgi:hypothetical protein
MTLTRLIGRGGWVEVLDTETPVVPHMDGDPWPCAARTTDARAEALDETVL